MIAESSTLSTDHIEAIHRSEEERLIDRDAVPELIQIAPAEIERCALCTSLLKSSLESIERRALSPSERGDGERTRAPDRGGEGELSGSPERAEEFRPNQLGSDRSLDETNRPLRAVPVEGKERIPGAKE